MANVSFSADDTIHKPLEVGEILAGDSSTNAFDETMKFVVEKEKTEAGKIFDAVYAALTEKGYNPINQLVGYLLSGDPTYITNFKEARSQIRKVERDELLEELVRFYLKDR
ncbi:MAG: IreB family regulatory phosphoprotein [Negativicutes bacterium]|mgnify:FL=1|nr:IreB family regulatory phosphoprotein [Negativicutes bacterium]